jgi:hypothetical protein
MVAVMTPTIERNNQSGRAGRREVLTKAIAKKIVGIVEAMPDEGVAVNWENVVFQIKSRLGVDLQRNVLSKKKWDNRRLIFEAYCDAKAVERRMRHQERLKYAHSSNKVLRSRVDRIEQNLQDLQTQLTVARLVRPSPLDVYRIRRGDLVLHSPEAAGDAGLVGKGLHVPNAGGGGGRIEVLTEHVAIQIGVLIRQMPVVGIPVTWDNVIAKIRSHLGFTFGRNVLSQKQWDGRRLLAEAYREAKLIQGKLSLHAPLKGGGGRQGMRSTIAAREAQVDALKVELANERLKQLASLELFRQDRFDLRIALQCLRS